MIYISDKAKEKIDRLRADAGLTDEYFLRVGVNTAFFMSGASKIELLEATNAANSISKFIEKKRRRHPSHSF